MSKPEQRVVQINRISISHEFERFAGQHYRFASTPDLNDMWLEISFDDPDFEAAVVHHIRHLLGMRYSRLRNAPIIPHDCNS